MMPLAILVTVLLIAMSREHSFYQAGRYATQGVRAWALIAGMLLLASASGVDVSGNLPTWANIALNEPLYILEAIADLKYGAVVTLLVKLLYTALPAAGIIALCVLFSAQWGKDVSSDKNGMLLISALWVFYAVTSAWLFID